jgi:hypothetical protein
MQRRAAAAYFVFFVVLGASAFSVMALAEHPHVDIEGQAYGQGDSFQVNDEEYTVAELTTEESEGGGHGGGGGGSTIVGALTWTNESARSTATLENNSTVSYEDREWTLLVENDSSVDSFVLEETFDVPGILGNDTAVYNQTVLVDGEERVVYRSNNSTVALSEYLPPRDTRQFSEGDDYRYPEENVTTTVDAVDPGAVTLAWIAPAENEIELTEGANVTLGGQQYVVHFPSESQVQISPEVAAYQQDLREQDYFAERTNGLWGIVILSVVAAILIVAMAYMPSRG